MVNALRIKAATHYAIRCAKCRVRDGDTVTSRRDIRRRMPGAARNIPRNATNGAGD